MANDGDDVENDDDGFPSFDPHLATTMTTIMHEMMDPLILLRSKKNGPVARKKIPSGGRGKKVKPTYPVPMHDGQNRIPRGPTRRKPRCSNALTAFMLHT